MSFPPYSMARRYELMVNHNVLGEAYATYSSGNTVVYRRFSRADMSAMTDDEIDRLGLDLDFGG